MAFEWSCEKAQRWVAARDRKRRPGGGDWLDLDERSRGSGLGHRSVRKSGPEARGEAEVADERERNRGAVDI